MLFRSGGRAVICHGLDKAREAIENRPFDLIILDPPYDDVVLRAALLERLAGPVSVVAPRGLVVATGRRRRGTDGQEGSGALRLVREMMFGESVIELRERGVEES